VQAATTAKDQRLVQPGTTMASRAAGVPPAALLRWSKEKPPLSPSEVQPRLRSGLLLLGDRDETKFFDVRNRAETEPSYMCPLTSSLGPAAGPISFCDRFPRDICLLTARDGHHEMFGLGANGARVHSCTHSRVSHMAKINNQRMEWAYDRRNQRRCNKQRHCDASAVPGWTMGHYAVADLASRTSRAPVRPSFTQTGWPGCLEGPNLSLAVTIFPDTSSRDR
jgi:hypothetical protein